MTLTFAAADTPSIPLHVVPKDGVEAFLAV